MRKEGNAQRRSGWEYLAFRRKVLRRDKNQCRWCNYEGQFTFLNLEVHHIIPVSQYPEGECDPDNGITLCKTHHRKVLRHEHEHAEFFSALTGKPLRAPPVGCCPTGPNWGICTRCGVAYYDLPSVMKRRKYCSVQCSKAAHRKRSVKEEYSE